MQLWCEFVLVIIMHVRINNCTIEKCTFHCLCRKEDALCFPSALAPCCPCSLRRIYNIFLVQEWCIARCVHLLYIVKWETWWRTQYHSVSRDDYCTKNFKDALITLDLYYDLDTWWELTCHPTKSNYDIILDRADIFFISEEKKCCSLIPVRGPQKLLHVCQPPFELHRDCRRLVSTLGNPRSSSTETVER